MPYSIGEYRIDAETFEVWHASILSFWGNARVSDSIFVGVEAMLLAVPSSADVDIDNITLVGNQSPKDWIIWNGWGGAVSVSNSILLGYGGGLITGPVTFSHSILEGAYNDTTDAWEFGGTDAGGNSDADSNDPLLVDPDGDDDILGTSDDDVSLSSSSPAIDAGDNAATTSASDVAGNPRIVDGDSNTSEVVDIGAYEYQ